MRAGGSAVWTGDGRSVERDTMTCAHCNCVTIVAVKPAAPNTGFCRMCMKSVCLKCEALGKCTPFEKRLEADEARDRLRRAAGV